MKLHAAEKMSRKLLWLLERARRFEIGEMNNTERDSAHPYEVMGYEVFRVEEF